MERSLQFSFMRGIARLDVIITTSRRKMGEIMVRMALRLVLLRTVSL
jgi:hypothetical protein